MISKIKRKIFWIAGLFPILVLLFVLAAYNFFYISFNLSDEKEALAYCASCVEKHTDLIDSYLHLQAEGLDAAGAGRAEGNRKAVNLLYAIMSSDVGIIKLDGDVNVMGRMGSMGDADPSLCKGDQGRLGNMLYAVVRKEGARYIVFLDTRVWHTAIGTSVAAAFLGLIAAAVLLGAVASYLSKRVMRPIEKALVQQNRFLADVCHELKTPISVINANMSVLERECGKSRWMDYIKEEGHSMNRLLNQLLSLCRLEHDANEAERLAADETFNVYESIMECALPFDSLAFEKKACISADCPAELASRGNPDDFKRILQVLLDNAIRHVDEGGSIAISVKKAGKFAFAGERVLPGRQNSLLVTISNTGPMIDEADLPFIFERFYKAHSSRAAASGSGNSGGCKAGNFGLGLSIAKALADRNSFGISVSSGNNRTSFTVSIPYVQARKKKRG